MHHVRQRPSARGALIVSVLIAACLAGCAETPPAHEASPLIERSMATRAETPLPTATPPPDLRGLLPPPAGARIVTSTLSESPLRQTLEALQLALDSRDPARVVALLDPGGMTVGPVHRLYGAEGLAGLDLAEPVTDTLQLLDDLFQAGSDPTVQGYLLTYPWEGFACGQIVIHGFRGEVPLPLPGRAGSSGLEHYPPEGAAAWNVCGHPDTMDWGWSEWLYMEYYGGVADLRRAQGSIEAPYVALRE